MTDTNRQNQEFIRNSIAIHSGKMSGIPSISTSVTLNENCKHHAAVKGSICEKCYARNLVKLRKGLADKLERNYNFYTTVDLTVDDVPFINSAIFRFESFGDLVNVQHFRNYCTIAKANPQTRFVLWTKNIWIISEYRKTVVNEIPSNLYIIASSVYINKSAMGAVKKTRSALRYIDAVFTVYDKETIKAENIDINCGGRKCLECRRCYSLKHGQIADVRERLK